MGSEDLVMYRIKPVFELTKEISIPTNMYKIKNLHSGTAKSVNEEVNDDIDNVRKRQEILLHKLGEIKIILATLKNEVAGPKIDTVGKKATKMCGKPNFSEFGITHDVVLNLSIKNQCPPYSLLVINKVWPGIFLKYSWHLHSSATFLPPAFKHFQQQFETTIPEGEPDLNIRVVWKTADTDCEFVISPIKSVPLLGEVNFLRFLNVSFNNNLDVVEQTLIDEKLDACYCLARSQSYDDMKPYLLILSNGLQGNQWLHGDNMSVVDIAAWSVFKRMKKHNLGVQSLNEWYKYCNKILDV